MDIAKSYLSLLFGISLTLMLVACGGAHESSAKYLEKGKELFQNNNITKSRIAFRNALQVDPKSADGFYWYARTEEYDQNWNKAFALYTRALELDPKHKDAQVRLGRIYLMGGEEDKALELADAVLSMHPDEVGALVLKGIVQAKQGQAGTAIVLARDALAKAPDNHDALSLVAALLMKSGQGAEAVDLVRQAWQKNRKDVPTNLLLARLYEEQANVSAADGIYQDLIAQEPNEAKNRLNYFHFLVRIKEIEKADEAMADAILAIEDPQLVKEWVPFLQKYRQQNMEERLTKLSQLQPANADLLLALAKAQGRAAQWQASEANYQKILEGRFSAVSHTEAELGLALNEMQKGEFQASKRRVDRVLAMDAKNLDALLLRAGLSMQMSDPDKGIADLRVLLREDPTQVRAYRLKAQAHLKKQEIQLARQALEKAISIQPEEAEANFELAVLLDQAGEKEEVVSVLERLLKYVPNHEASLMALADIYWKKQAWVDLKRIAKMLNQHYPKKPTGNYYNGLALFGEGQSEEAIASFEAALKKAPYAIEPLKAKAEVLIHLKRLDEALSAVEERISANEKKYLAMNLKGEILRDQGDLNGAVDTFQQAIALEPKWPVAYVNLSDVRSKQGKPEQSLAVLQQGFEKTGDITVGAKLAVLSDHQGKTSEAESIYRQLLSKSPNLDVAANNLAMILVRGAPEKSALEEALVLTARFEHSSHAGLLDTLGWVLFLNGQEKKAESILARAAHLGKKDPTIQYHLARLYLKTGRKTQAREGLKKALASGDGFLESGHARELLKTLSVGF